MKSFRGSNFGARNSIQGTRAGVRSRGRNTAKARRRPWVFSPAALGDVPYVFTPPADTEPAPPPPAAADAADTADTADQARAEPDAPPADAAIAGNTELGLRRPPLRRPVPRSIGGATATLDWKPFEITQFPIVSPPTGGGVYIVRGSSGGPLYVGEAASFAARWHKRLLESFQAGLIDPKLGGHSIKLWLGTASSVLSPEARKTLESSLIRILINGGLGAQLRNDTSFNELTPLAPIKIGNALPPGLRGQLTPRPGLNADARRAVEQVRDANVLDLAAKSVFEVQFYELTPGP